MRLADGDLLTIPIQQLGRLEQDELLRIVVICRESDEAEQTKRAKAAWRALVTGDSDRVRGIVATFRFPNHASVHVAKDDVEQVAQDAWLRLVEKVLPGFRGTSIGEFRAAMRTCVRYECMDHCRARMQEDRRRKGSLDEQVPNPNGEARARFDDAMFKKELERLEKDDATERARERLAAVQTALDAMDSPNKRRVLELTWDGRTTQEIAAELGISADNVYQLRKRGMDLLNDLLDDEGTDDDGDN